jgi:hypothetical protein
LQLGEKGFHPAVSILTSETPRGPARLCRNFTNSFASSRFLVMLVIVGAKELRFISGFGCFGRLVIEANKRGTRVCGGRESRSRLTDNSSPERAIVGTTIKQRRAITTSVAIYRRQWMRYESESKVVKKNANKFHSITEIGLLMESITYVDSSGIK